MITHLVAYDVKVKAYDQNLYQYFTGIPNDLDTAKKKKIKG